MNRIFYKLSLIVLVTVLISSCVSRNNTGPFFATGIKIGEVSQDEAIIWLRLTKNPERVSDTVRPIIRYKDPDTGELIELNRIFDMTPVVRYPEGYSVENIEGACPGTNGKVRVKYRNMDGGSWMESEWTNVDSDRDYTKQIKLSGLEPGNAYTLIAEARAPEGKRNSASIEGKFKTAPEKDVVAEVKFIVTTGTSYNDVDSEDGYKMYPSSLALDPDFFVHTGDIVYYDREGKTEALARWHWDRMYSFPNNIEYHSHVSSYFIKDDHDTWMNDCYPGQKTQYMGEFTFEQGKQIFLDEVPMEGKTNRTYRWGKDLQVWLMEGRDYRSKNTAEDGPDKSIWGKEQMAWFTSTVEASDATFKILISPTPVVGPDRGNKKDNHANEGFTYEGDKVREFISEQQNMYVICGDRHWQYVSKEMETGVIEFSCGPGSDAHAGGWSNDQRLPEHIYLNVVGGFLEATVSRSSGEPQMIIRHYNPDGGLLHEYVAETGRM